MFSLTKLAARYASQPTLPQSPMGGFGGAQGMTHTSRLTGMGPNSGIAQAANAAQQNPNPLTQVSPGKHGLATTGGIQQAAQQAQQNAQPQQQQAQPPQMGPNPFGQQQTQMPKMGSLRARPGWLERLIPQLERQVKLAEVQTGGSMAPSASTSPLGGGGNQGVVGAGNPGMGTPAKAPGSQNQNGAQGGGGGQGAGGPGNAMGGMVGGGRLGAYGVVRPGWDSLRPNASSVAPVTSGGLGPKLASAMPPTPGLTANSPVPQPGMPPTAQPMPPGMPPPNGGAPVAGTMGQPSVDPMTGQPIQPPGSQPPGQPGAAPPPGGDPSQMQAQGPPPGPINPMTGQPTTSPMQDPPPPTLPMNPPMAPQRPPNPMDVHQQGMTESLMAEKNRADNPVGSGEALEDIQSQASALGSKTARDFAARLAVSKSGFEKDAILGCLFGRDLRYIDRLMTELATATKIATDSKSTFEKEAVGARALRLAKLVVPAGNPRQAKLMGRTIGKQLGGHAPVTPATAPLMAPPSRAEAQRVARAVSPMQPTKTYPLEQQGIRTSPLVGPQLNALATSKGPWTPLRAKGSYYQMEMAESRAAQANAAADRIAMSGRHGKPTIATESNLAAGDGNSVYRGFTAPRPDTAIGYGIPGFHGAGSVRPHPTADVPQGSPFWTTPLPNVPFRFADGAAVNAGRGGVTPGASYIAKMKTPQLQTFGPSSPVAHPHISQDTRGMTPDAIQRMSAGKEGPANFEQVFTAPGANVPFRSFTSDAYKALPSGTGFQQVLKSGFDKHANTGMDAVSALGQRLRELMSSGSGNVIPEGLGRVSFPKIDVPNDEQQHSLAFNVGLPLLTGLGAAGAGYALSGRKKPKEEPSEKEAGAKWRTDAALGILGLGSPGGSVSSSPRLMRLMQAKHNLGLPISLPGITGRLSSLPKADIGNASTVAGTPKTVFRGHHAGSPAQTYSDGVVHASPMPGVAVNYGNVAGLPTQIMGGSASAVSAYRVPPTQAYYPNWSAHGNKGPATAEEIMASAKRSSLLSRAIPKRLLRIGRDGDVTAGGLRVGRLPPTKGMYETNVAQLRPSATYLTDMSGSGVELPAGKSGEKIVHELNRTVAQPLGFFGTSIRPKKLPPESHSTAKKADYDACTPFARGFFEACDTYGVDHQDAVEKVGADYGDDARRELREGLEKLAFKQWVGRQLAAGAQYGRGALGLSPGAVPAAARAAPRAVPKGGLPPGLPRPATPYTPPPAAYGYGAATRNYAGGAMRFAGPQLAPTAGGAFMGGMAGDDLGLGGDHFDIGPDGFPISFNTRGALAGAAAANPMLRRRAGANLGGGFGVPMAGMRTAGYGSLGGGAVDNLAGAAGYDTQGRFGRIGAQAGFGLGAARHGLGLANMKWGGKAGNPLLNQASAQAGKFDRGVENFSNESFRGLHAPMMYPARAGYNYMRGRPMPKLFGNATTGAGRAGRMVGLGTFGVGGAGLGYGMARDKITDDAREALGQTMAESMPELQQGVTDWADNYMMSRGMMNEDGQFDPMVGANRRGGVLGGVMRGSDDIFRSLGMDPSRMSPLQKIMILGGAVGGGGGMLAGSPALAGMGGVSALAGLLPQIMPSQSQQQFNGPQAPYRPGQPQGQGNAQGGPQARNEWEWQQQLQQQGQG